MGMFVWPCPGYSRISSPFGNRGSEFHTGVDLAAPKGTPILAAASGKVITVKYLTTSYGHHVKIDHGNGYSTLYGHMSNIDVKNGQSVNAGQKIGGVGSTGRSTGNHLHFEIRVNGAAKNPLNYVSRNDTLSSYTGPKGSASGGSGSTAKTVKAKYTAYYPANNSMQGGFYDAQGNRVDPSKRTCAAPPSIPFGTLITIKGTGTAKDGLTYKVTDRGGAIKIVNGVYHFDLLMSTKAECIAWGVVYGEAVIGGDSSADEAAEPEKKEITTVVIKSVTGAAGVHKQILRDVPPYLQAGAEILIQNDQIYLPVTADDISWEIDRKGSPSKLEFTVMKDPVLNFQEGNPISFRFNGQNIFYGFVFTKSRTDLKSIDVTCYDQLRYLKNKDTLSYTNKTYGQLLQMIAADYGLTCGTVEDTGYVIPNRIEEGTLLDMLGNASDLTILNNGKLFVLYDDFGKLTLKNIQSMMLPILIDEDTGEKYNYSSTIDKDTYNRIKLAVDNDTTGEREVHILNEGDNQSRWGVLQYYEKLDAGTSEAGIKEKAKILMKYYNKKQRNLKINGVFGDIRVRGGSSLVVKMELGDINVQNYMVVEKVKHTFSHGLHTMDLTLSGIKGEFVV